jgi:hypothetical protein
VIAIFAADAIQAQEASPFSFNLGAGFVEPIGTFGRYNDTGWNVQGGAGFNFNQLASLMLDANFNSMGINPTTLNNFGAPGGTVQIWSFTLAADFEPVFGPFGFFNVPVAGNQVQASYSVNRPGFDLGARVNLGSKWRAKFYAEARYNRMFTDFGVTDYIPVTFGIRF